MINPHAVMYDARMTVKRWQEVEKDGIPGMNWRLWHRIVLAGTALPGRPRSAPQIPLSRTAINCFVGWRRMFGRETGSWLLCVQKRR